MRKPLLATERAAIISTAATPRLSPRLSRRTHPDCRATERIANTSDAISDFLDTIGHDVLVVFEATSGCDSDLIAALAERGHPFSRVNPRQAREFAHATGVLAQMGSSLDLPVTVPLSEARARK